METTRRPHKRACDSCYRRKIQCDGEQPHCNWCKHHDLACTFDRPSRVKKPPKPRKEAKASGLSRRLERLEKILAEKTSQVNTLLKSAPGEAASAMGSPDPTGVSPARLCDQPSKSSVVAGSFGKLHFAGYQLGEISSVIGVPLFSAEGQRWIQSRTGQTAALPRSAVPFWNNQQHRHDSTVSSSNFDMPDRKISEEYFSIFRSSPIRFVFPLVDIEVFSRTIDAAYEPQKGHPTANHSTAKACVLSFLSVVSMFEPAVDATPIDGDACALKAQYLLPQLLLEASIDALQVALMQCLFNLFSGNLQTSIVFHSLACRMIFMLGGHIQATDLQSAVPKNETADSWRTKCHLRKYFWMCYSIDKDIALRSGHPPAIPDDYCDLTLSWCYAEGNGDSLHVDGGSDPFLPGDLRLSLIKSKALRLLYSTDALKKSDAQLLRDVRELDDELEVWRISLNPQCRPTLSCRAEERILDPNASVAQKMHCIIMNFEYHHLVATIHQATSRCRSWYNSESGEIEGASSSLALSVAASRSTLNYLRTAVQVLAGEAFWMIIFYPMSAVLTLFCNILLNPLTPQAEGDLELLITTPQLIKNIPIRRLTMNEIIHIKLIEDFVADLTRLGSCAIQKARQEQNTQTQ